MNQILLRDKIYMTPELIRKKKIYKIRIIISLILILGLITYYIYAEVERNKEVAVASEIMNQISSQVQVASVQKVKDDTTTKKIVNDVLIVELDREASDAASSEIAEPVRVEETTVPADDSAASVTTVSNSGVSYTTEAVLDIPSLGINYPVLSETSEELLKISLNKFWGGKPNAVGNYVIVGHNYANGNLFGKLSQISVGDTLSLTDMMGRKVNYEVYDRYIVDPEDVSCTSQLTNGRVEMTLITCKEYGTKRLVVKCRKI